MPFCCMQTARRKAFEPLQLPRLDRVLDNWLAVCAWSDAVHCHAAAGSSLYNSTSLQAMLIAVCCSATACTETALSLKCCIDVFMHRPVLRWLDGVRSCGPSWCWAATHSVPLDASVLLAADHTVWARGGGKLDKG